MHTLHHALFRTSSKTIVLLGLIFVSLVGRGQKSALLTLDMDQPGTVVSPTLHGLMTEEINHAFDGGLYGELIQNRIFKDHPSDPVHWSLSQAEGGKGTISLDREQPINDALTVCLRLEVENPGSMGIANDGFWGIAVRPQTTYKVSFYAKAKVGSGSNLMIQLESKDGKAKYASATVSGLTNQWKRFSTTLTTEKGLTPIADARFVLSTKEKGTYWFNLVSLFPPTYNNRTNGNRTDLMKLLADMKPAFLRFPGGNYLEGFYFSESYPWKKTLGPIDQRAGHPSCWGYRSSDGMGLLEFLQWCEDLNMEPLLDVFAGFTLKGDYLTGPFLEPFVKDALNQIEYVTGDTTTKWGAVRAKDGHPAPFKLRYVEIGNEDYVDPSGSYGSRYAQFYQAIKAAYPQLEVISSVSERDLQLQGTKYHVSVPKPDVIDEHFYRTSWSMQEDATHYDEYNRAGPKIFVGEWATTEGKPTTNFNAALGDAAWLTGMERNSDVVIMQSYAPLLVNVNPGASQWDSNLIGFDALTSFGSPSYYVQKMFSNYLGNRVVPMTGENIPMQTQHLEQKDLTAGQVAKKIPALFYVATTDTTNGNVFLKIVNTLDRAQTIDIRLKGKVKVASKGLSVVLSAKDPNETNTITDPQHIIPVNTKIKGVGRDFTRTLPPYSVSVFQLETK